MDYPAVPAQTTADGDTLGANRQDLGDALESGPSIKAGTNGEVSYQAPGWTVEEGKPKYDPDRRGNKNTSANTPVEVTSEEEE